MRPPAAGTGALQQVLSGICRTLLDRRVCAVSAGAPQADTYTGCLHLRATLTYREDLEDGDGEYERQDNAYIEALSEYLRLDARRYDGGEV